MRAVLRIDLPALGLRKGAEGTVVSTSKGVCSFKVDGTVYHVDRADLALGGIEITEMLDKQALHVSDIKSTVIPDRESHQTTRPIESINRRPSNVGRK